MIDLVEAHRNWTLSDRCPKYWVKLPSLERREDTWILAFGEEWGQGKGETGRAGPCKSSAFKSRPHYHQRASPCLSTNSKPRCFALLLSKGVSFTAMLTKSCLVSLTRVQNNFSELRKSLSLKPALLKVSWFRGHQEPSDLQVTCICNELRCTRWAHLQDIAFMCYVWIVSLVKGESPTSTFWNYLLIGLIKICLTDKSFIVSVYLVYTNVFLNL